MDIVRECAEAWEKLITGKSPRGDIALYVTSILLSKTALTLSIAPTAQFPTLPTVSTQPSSTFPRAKTGHPALLTPALTSGSSSPAPHPLECTPLEVPVD